MRVLRADEELVCRPRPKKMKGGAAQGHYKSRDARFGADRPGSSSCHGAGGAPFPEGRKWSPRPFGKSWPSGNKPLKCLLRKQQAFCLFWRGSPAICRSRAERRRRKAFPPISTSPENPWPGTDGARRRSRVYARQRRELVLHIGGELIEYSPRRDAAEERVDPYRPDA